MSSVAIAFNQLPSDIREHLCPVGEFYIYTNFKEEIERPPRIQIGANIYYRFMNYLYLPQPPESLSPQKVIEICDLRLDYINKLVDYNHNRRVVAAIANYLESNFHDVTTVSKIKTLDFGCGSGLSSELIQEYMGNLEIIGVDISEKAIIQSKTHGFNTILTYPGKPLPFADASFDLVLAIFVMHFNIDISTLAEVRRVLRVQGKFVFNLYQRAIDGVEQQLKEAGFDSVEIIKSLPELGANHMIVSCSILPS